MATQLSTPAYRQWERQKSSIEPVSRTSSESFGSTGQSVHIRPTMTDLSVQLDASRAKVFLHEEYLSSEEALSSGDLDDEISDYEQLIDDDDEVDDNDFDEQIAQAIRNSIVQIAVQVAIRVARPSVVSIPPSPTKAVPAIPLRQRPPMFIETRRPTVQTNFSGSSFSRASTPSPKTPLPVRPVAAFANYPLDDSPSSDRSSPRDSLPDYDAPSAIKRSHRATFVFRDSFATGRTSSQVSLQDILREPPPVQSSAAPALKARPGSFRMLSGRISDRTKRAAEPDTSPKSSWQPPASMESTPLVPARKFPKREARGASERSPTITIPPCPYEPADPWFTPMSSESGVLRKQPPRRLRATSLQPLNTAAAPRIRYV